ncbi:MAG: branched-chain amino acid ABC transporter substrate-binding protein [Nitrospinaceae bacterium]|jgi:branched-chain amino acid transport system substrate-binding protein|nr:branched-chain amino acid ABC transporter substrate-binding protein [Nitrospinaceae bacterium]MBT3434656.1 branched-chain amino acid ABC transporter substrate-binding protein [Nitrospinaceae bacterium]MBT4432594.1 branched-chain amino acid ABC transporter substrate-binding protein [Nitrospinaceae bacterium]MBT5946041.1 branched-chain amino acid ABC transporter substrate-binding protein [Nitrospinaceae bacterium]MBT6393251.1 branched-chain amino acid ABC transporter substrate-binding protein 
MYRTIIRIVVSMVFMALLALPSGAGAAVIKIGVAGPLTGDQAAFGEMLKNGALLAVSEWNNKGGVSVGGKKMKVEILWGDDRHDPREGVSIAHKFVNSGVVGVVGHFNSSVSIPASTVYAESGVVQITPASTNPKLTEQNFNTVFRVCGRDDQQGEVAAAFIVGKLKKTRVAILHDKTTYGQGLANETKRFLEAKGVKPVFYSGIIQGDKDFSPVLTAMKQKNPEVVFFGGIHPEAILLVKQMREHLGIKADFVSGDGVFVDEFYKIAGKSAEGSYLTFTPDQAKIPAAKGIIKKHRERFGKEVGAYTIYSYVAANMILSSIAETGSTKGAKMAKYMRSKVWSTALGKIQFNKKGDVLESPYVFWQVRGSKFVQID